MKFLALTEYRKHWRYSSEFYLLGKWCAPFDINTPVVDYPYDDREKLFSDYQYCQELYKRLLPKLSDCLNIIHCENYPVIYWRIVIGPWLYHWIQNLKERYEVIRQAERQLGNFETYNYQLDFNKFEYASLNYSGFFQDLLVGNNLYFSYIINFLDICYKSNKAWITDININTKYKIKQALLGRHLGEFREVKIDIDRDKRNQLQRIKLDNHQFEEMLIDSLKYFMPKSYIENYKHIKSIAQKNIPKFIEGGSRFESEDYFKIKAALTKVNGGEVVVYQHGGHYGIGKWNPNEDHEKQIADKYHTFSPQSIKHKPSKKRYIYFVSNSFPRYFYKNWACPVAGQTEEYFNLQIQFIEALGELRKYLIYRPYPKDYGWGQTERIQRRFPEVKIDRSKNYRKMLEKSSIVVCDANQTLYRELEDSEKPSVIFWNSKYWETNPRIHFLSNAITLEDNKTIVKIAAQRVMKLWN